MKKVKQKLQDIAWWLGYFRAATALAVMRDISWATWRHALNKYPVAVCGRRCSWVIDPNFK